MKDLYLTYNQLVAQALSTLPHRLEEIFGPLRTRLAELETDETTGGLTRKSFSGWTSIATKEAHPFALEILGLVDSVVSSVIRSSVFSLVEINTAQANEELVAGITDLFAQSDVMGKSRQEWLAWLTAMITSSVTNVAFPGRRTKDSVSSFTRAIMDYTYPSSVIAATTVLLRTFCSQALRDVVINSFLKLGRARVRLVCNHDNEACRTLEGVYDVRFLPEVPSADCTCIMERVDEPDSYPDKVFVNHEPVVVPTQEEILAKEKVVAKLPNILGGRFTYHVKAELEFMKEAYNAFATDSYAAGKAFGRTVSGRNTVSFGDEIEILVKHIYGGVSTAVKSPVDVINETFCIETKASSAMSRSEQERGHIANAEVVRKYQFIESLKLRGETEGHHKYVLGVFSTDGTTVTLYEQNYLSNKNSATMIPVCTIFGYNELRWSYESTPYREFKVVDLLTGIPYESIVWHRTQEQINDPFFWEVQRAHRSNTRDGDPVIHFDGERVRNGVLYDESLDPTVRERTKRNFDLYHGMFPRRGTYAIQFSVDHIIKYLQGQTQGQWSLSEEFNLADLPILEFDDLHHLEGFNVLTTIGITQQRIYTVQELPTTFLTSALLSEAEYSSLKPHFEAVGLSIEPVTSLRRIRRVNSLGRLEYDIVRHPVRAFAQGPVIMWEDGEIEQVDYNTFNANYRLLRQGAFETLEERGLATSKLPPYVDLSNLTAQEKNERLQMALAALSTKVK